MTGPSATDPPLPSVRGDAPYRHLVIGGTTHDVLQLPIASMGTQASANIADSLNNGKNVVDEFWGSPEKLVTVSNNSNVHSSIINGEYCSQSLDNVGKRLSGESLVLDQHLTRLTDYGSDDENTCDDM